MRRGASETMDQNAIFNEFFRPFNFRSMFEDDDFIGMQDTFNVNPHIFATNFS